MALGTSTEGEDMIRFNRKETPINIFQTIFIFLKGDGWRRSVITYEPVFPLDQEYATASHEAGLLWFRQREYRN